MAPLALERERGGINDGLASTATGLILLCLVCLLLSFWARPGLRSHCRLSGNLKEVLNGLSLYVEIVGVLPGKRAPQTHLPEVNLLSWMFRFGHNWLSSECYPWGSEVPFSPVWVIQRWRPSSRWVQRLSYVVAMFFLHSLKGLTLSSGKRERIVFLGIIRVTNIFLKREREKDLGAVAFLFHSYLSALLPLGKPEWSAGLLVGMSYECIPVPEEIISGWDRPITLESVGVSSKG